MFILIKEISTIYILTIKMGCRASTLSEASEEEILIELERRRRERAKQEARHKNPLDTATDSEKKILNASDSDKYRFKRGMSIFEDGGQYIGEYDPTDGITRSGKGVYSFPGGNVYDGHWARGLFHGRGIMKCTEGQRDESNNLIYYDVYDGEWKDGKRDGKGTSRLVCGDVYEGEWQDGLKHGIGKYTYSDGETYVGEHNCDMRHGTGLFTFKSGDFSTFEGTFEQNRMVAGKLSKLSEQQIEGGASSFIVTYDGVFTGGDSEKRNEEGNRVYVLTCKHADGSLYKSGKFINGKFV